METRELRYFVAVAEELHFGRAATRLGIAQPPLSRAIGQLERRLGARLLERTSRTVSLTPAGEVLLREARAALDAVVAAERRTRRAAGVAAGGRAGLVLVSKAGAANELVAKLLDQYAAEPGAVGVDVLLVGPGQQEQALRDGRADVALLHAPWDDAAGFDTEVLQVEEAAVLVAAGHPLTGGGAVPAGDLDALVGLPAPRWPDREGRYAAGAGPEVHDVTQLLQLIALGRTYLVALASARALAGEGVAAVPLVGAPPVTTMLAWPSQSRSTDLAAFVRVAARA